jgi:hypothetical protein
MIKVEIPPFLLSCPTLFSPREMSFLTFVPFLHSYFFHSSIAYLCAIRESSIQLFNAQQGIQHQPDLRNINALDLQNRLSSGLPCFWG